MHYRDVYDLVLNSAIETVPVPIFDFRSDIQDLLNFPDVAKSPIYSTLVTFLS